MKRFLSAWIFVIGVLAILTGCQEDPVVKKATLTLEKTEITVPAEGGRFAVQFQLENPVEGAQLRVTPEHDWVSNIEVSEAGVLSFDVALSRDQAERVCRLDLAYPGIYPNGLIKVRQEKGLPPSFSYNVKEVNAHSFVADVLPLDKEMPYLFLVGYGDYMKENGMDEDDAALIADDIAYFESFAANFGVDVKDAIQSFMYQGDQLDYKVNGTTPNTEYVLYAYGFDINTMTPTTEVCRHSVMTREIENKQVMFDFDIVCDGPKVSLTITPEDYAGHFFFDLMAVEDCPEGLSQEEINAICYEVWESWKNYHMMFGFEIADVLKILAYRDQATWEGELDCESDYVVFAYTMDEEAIIDSDTQVEYFTTGSVQPSENVIDLSVSDIYSRKATVTVTPSNTDPYVALVVAENRFEGMSDDEIMDYIVENFTLNIVNKGFTTSVTGLTPESTYHLIAFGVSGGQPNTELFKTEFTTGAKVYSSSSMTLTAGPFYDTQDIAALDPAWSDYTAYDAMFPVEVELVGKAENVYYGVLDSYNYQYFSEEQRYSYLVDFGPCEMSAIFALDYDEELVLFGFVEDVDGNYSEIWGSEPFTLLYENRSDAQEFLDALAATQNKVPVPQRVQEPRNQRQQEVTL